MDSAEFAEWQAYYQIDPFGDEREDIRHALVPYMLACAFSKKGKRPKFNDFLVSQMLNPEVKAQTKEQMFATLKAFAARSNKNGNNR